jgi:polysaccharide biosynthesis transport protein
MSFSQFVTILRARWPSGMVVLLATVLLALGVSLLLPKAYTANASILVDVKSPDPIMGMSAAMLSPGHMATQVDLMKSERVARRAIQSLGLLDNAELREDWKVETAGVGDFGAWLVGALAKKLEVKPSRESNVINVSFSSRDPKFSAAMTNAYVKGFIDTTLELKTEPARQFNSFFDERAKRLRADVEEAQNRVSQYQKSQGITANDERLDVEQMRFAEISSQVVLMEAAAAEASSRVGQAGSTPDRMQEVLANPVVAGLQSDLARQEAKLEELTLRLGEANPQVLEARSVIVSLRAKLQSATARASGSVSVSSNVAQQRLAQLRAAKEEQRLKLLRLKGNRDELTVLQRDVENAQRAYDAVIQRANLTSLESQVTQTNVSVLMEATASPYPSSPKLLLNLAVALALGIVLGLITLLLREKLDPRLRTADDITHTLKLPVLLVMPRPASDSQRAKVIGQRETQRLSGQRLASIAGR